MRLHPRLLKLLLGSSTRSGRGGGRNLSSAAAAAAGGAAAGGAAGPACGVVLEVWQRVTLRQRPPRRGGVDGGEDLDCERQRHGVANLLRHRVVGGRLDGPGGCVCRWVGGVDVTGSGGKLRDIAVAVAA